MAVNTPETAPQVEDRIKADVKREAPDSNPFLKVHWLRSIIAGFARRLFDLYRDLNRVAEASLPDTADGDTAPRWGNIFVGPQNPSTPAAGTLIGTGVAGGFVDTTTVLTANEKEYAVTVAGTVIDTIFSISSITRSGSTATVTTVSDHGLASGVQVDITGATQTEYNVAGADITVTAADQFQYQVEGTPATPATGSPQADASVVTVTVQCSDFGADTNLDAGTPLTLQTPIVDVDDTFFVTFDGLSGGTDTESIPAYKSRYLDKIRNPSAHFNEADIMATAREVSGVTRVFVEPAGTGVGSLSVSSITRSGSVAKVVTSVAHNLEDGFRTTINGADQTEYNVVDAAVIVEDSTTFYYLVSGTPVTPATGTIVAEAVIPLGQVRTYFMRDNDDDPIPSAAEVATVKAAIDAIRPANTSSANNIVAAPSPITVGYTFTAISPDTATMRVAVAANLAQFHEEETSVGVDVTEEQYKAAIQNTVDPDTGDKVASFTLSSPAGDVSIASGQVAVLGAVTFP